MYGFAKVAAAAPKVTVGDVKSNAEKIIQLIEQAKKEGVRLIVFPELAITGYTAGDLFLQQTLKALLFLLAILLHT